MPQPKLTPRIEKITLPHPLAGLDGAPFTAREKTYLAGRLVKAVRLDFVRSEDSLLATKLKEVPGFPLQLKRHLLPTCWSIWLGMASFLKVPRL